MKTDITYLEVQKMFLDSFKVSYLEAENVLCKYKDILNSTNIDTLSNQSGN